MLIKLALVFSSTNWETSFSLVRNNLHGQESIKTRDFEMRLIAALI